MGLRGKPSCGGGDEWAGEESQAVVEEISGFERKAKLWWRRSVGLRGKPSCGGGDEWAGGGKPSFGGGDQ